MLDVEKFINGLHEYLGKALRPLADRIAALEKRGNENETFRYCGTWQAAGEYVRGNFVTHAGGMWHCNAPTREKPGVGTDWQLAVKGGAQ